MRKSVSRVHPTFSTTSTWRRGDGVEAMMQPWRRRDNLIYALPFCSRVVLGPLAVAARRLFAAAQINSLHGLDAARLAELQGLDLGMDCREEQRCN